MVRRPRAGVSVLKVGGGLLGVAGALDSVCDAIGHAGESTRSWWSRGRPLCRHRSRVERKVGSSPSAAHWMAHLAMDQYAELLAERIPGGRWWRSQAPSSRQWTRRVPVLAPSRWMRSADVLPHSWDVTSDSIGGIYCRCSGCHEAGPDQARAERREPVDSYFSIGASAGTAILDRMDGTSWTSFSTRSAGWTLAGDASPFHWRRASVPGVPRNVGLEQAVR